MNFLIVFALTIASTMAQRGHYAGSRAHGVPDVAWRFQNSDSSSNTNTNTNTNPLTNTNVNPNTNPNTNTIAGSNDPSLVSRFGDNSVRVPTDQFGNMDYSKIYETWPKENRPFEYANREIINKQLGISTGGRMPSRNSVQSRPLNSDGSFQNRLNNVNSASEQFNNRFQVVRNGQRRTYVYDPQFDAWYPSSF